MAGEQIVLGDSTGSIALFTVVDALRSGAVETIKRIREAGIRVHLISGDSMSEVKRVAEICGVDAWRGRVLPSEKQGYLTGLKESGRLVVMVGDGINDAPVLAAADASLAMGTGASLSQLSADGVILGGRFDSIFESVLISRKALRIMRQNLLWSFAYNLLVLPPAIAGWLSPWMAGLGMSFSSVIVVLNALRITRPNRADSDTADRIEMRVNA
jgi:Cu2+-exporting ATPase